MVDSVDPLTGPQWQALAARVVACRRCPRLVAWREQVADQKRRAYRDEPYWGKPVPGFGDHGARVLVIGLAPGAHGANRTGRMFTGDAAGEFLCAALHAGGFASQPTSTHIQDGLVLDGIYLGSVCRCAPPQNRLRSEEIAACRRYLQAEVDLLGSLEGVVALGKIAYDQAWSLLHGRPTSAAPVFSHGVWVAAEDGRPWLLGSYHPSRYNTQTGRLTRAMFAEIWELVRKQLD